MLIAKTLQNLANLTPFGAKEAYMIPLNDFMNVRTRRRPRVALLNAPFCRPTCRR